MLSKKNRLSKFTKRERTKTVSFPFFTLKYAKTGEKDLKFAFVISKKIDKRAVIRNKVKRQISKGLEGILEKITKGYNFVFIVKKEILTKNQGEITKEIERVFLERFSK